MLHSCEGRVRLYNLNYASFKQLNRHHLTFGILLQSHEKQLH